MLARVAGLAEVVEKPSLHAVSYIPQHVFDTVVTEGEVPLVLEEL